MRVSASTRCDSFLFGLANTCCQRNRTSIYIYGYMGLKNIFKEIMVGRDLAEGSPPVFQCGNGTEDDEEVTEMKIRAFLDEKAMELKKLQTPLYEEFFNSLNAAASPNAATIKNEENSRRNSNLPPKSKSPKEPPSQSFFEKRRIWEEELFEELERKREMMRHIAFFRNKCPCTLPICDHRSFEDDEEVTETKIRAFLDEKAMELKKLQTLLYEEFFNSLNVAASLNAVTIKDEETVV